MSEISFNVRSSKLQLFPVIANPFYTLSSTGHILIDKVIDDDNYVITVSLSHPKEIELREKVELYQTNLKRVFYPPSNIKYESFCTMKDCEFTFYIDFILGEVSSIVKFGWDVKVKGSLAKMLLGNINLKDFFYHVWNDHMRPSIDYIINITSREPHKHAKVNLASVINEAKSAKKTTIVTGNSSSAYFAIVIDEGDIVYAKYIDEKEIKKGLDAVFKALEIADKAEISVSSSD